MALIELENVTKRFGTVVAVDRLNLRIGPEEFLTLLGPSGCGKTTVLRMIAGLEIPDEGEIRIQGETVFSSKEGNFVPPKKRGVGLVFQSYALWPHMTVSQNVAFGLEVKKTDRRDLERRVTETLNYMQLQGMKDRYPQEMSGGQQQRVALARMLVTRPSVFLMDEPLSNLDAKLRMGMRSEIKRIHREWRSTTVYVTHDQTEALTLSTQVAVMDRGRLQQVAPPQALYRRPANLFVADFIGSPTINLIPGTVQRREGRLLFESSAFSLSAPFTERIGEKKVVAAIRPEDIQISRPGEENAFPGEVYSVLPAGAETIVQVSLEALRLTLRLVGEPALHAGDIVFLQVAREAVLFYDQEKGTLLDLERLS